MYKDKCVMVILDQQDQVLNEDSGRCSLQFGSEYKVRLRNKNDFSLLAKVTIDGRSITSMPGSGVVIDSHSKVDLERWIDKLTDGKKFKFVSINHPSAQDPYDSNNGVISVKLYKEKRKKFYLAGDNLKPINPPVIDPYPGIPQQPWIDMPIVKPMIWYGSSEGNNDIKYTTTSFCANVSQDNVGCTINGSSSDQSFSYSNTEYESDCFSSLTLKLVGVPSDKMKTNFCPHCGKKRKNNDNFCSKCGNKL